MRTWTLPAFALAGALGCATLAPSGPDESRAFEPPRPWQAAVYFVFSDSSLDPSLGFATRIEFNDGQRDRVVTARDLFRTESGGSRTPWYRLHPTPHGSRHMVRITLEHAGGARTTAEYPVWVHTDEYLTLVAEVDRANPGAWYVSMAPARRSYPLSAATHTGRADSLWVSHAGRTRRCFNCTQ